MNAGSGGSDSGAKTPEVNETASVDSGALEREGTGRSAPAPAISSIRDYDVVDLPPDCPFAASETAVMEEGTTVGFPPQERISKLQIRESSDLVVRGVTKLFRKTKISELRDYLYSLLDVLRISVDDELTNEISSLPRHDLFGAIVAYASMGEHKTSNAIGNDIKAFLKDMRSDTPAPSANGTPAAPASGASVPAGETGLPAPTEPENREEYEVKIEGEKVEFGYKSNGGAVKARADEEFAEEIGSLIAETQTQGSYPFDSPSVPELQTLTARPWSNAAKSQQPAPTDAFDLNALLAKLGPRIEDMVAERVEAVMPGTVEAVDNAVAAAVQQRLLPLQERLDDMQRANEPLRTQLQALTDSVQEYNADLALVRREVGKARVSANERFDRLADDYGGRLTRVETKAYAAATSEEVDKLAAAATGANSALGGVKQDIAEIRTSISQLHARVDEVARGIAHANERVARLDKGVRDLSSASAELRGDLDSVRRDHEGLAASVRRMKAELQRLQADIGQSIETRVAEEVQSSISALGAGLRADFDSLRDGMSGIRSNYERVLQTTLSELDKSRDWLTDRISERDRLLEDMRGNLASVIGRVDDLNSCVAELQADTEHPPGVGEADDRLHELAQDVKRLAGWRDWFEGQIRIMTAGTPPEEDGE